MQPTTLLWICIFLLVACLCLLFALLLKKSNSSSAANEKTRFILSHIPSPKKRSVHEELSERAREDGFTVAYDGYFLTV